MARVTATKVRQVIVVTGAALPEGFDPETIAFYNSDGTPFDFSEITGSYVWSSAWDIGVGYAPNIMVKHADALWIAVATAPVGVEPGVPLETTTDAPGGVEPPGTYTRLEEGTLAAEAWPSPDGFLYFFDLAVGGDILITTSVNNGWAERLYDAAGALLVTSDPGGPLIGAELLPGRYFVWLPYPAGAADPTDITLEFSGAQQLVEPWELMVQGVAP